MRNMKQHLSDEDHQVDKLDQDQRDRECVRERETGRGTQEVNAVPNEVISKHRCAWRHYNYELGSSKRRKHPDCRCRQVEPNWDWLVEMYTPVDQAIEPLSPRWT